MSFSITQSAISNMISSSLDADSAQLATLQQQLSSGQNITEPSQDPAGLVESLSLTSQLNRANQYSTNATDGLIVAKMADATLSNAVNALQQARTTLVAAGGPGITASSASGLIGSLKAAYASLMGLANTSYMGQAIFAGTSGASTAYDASGNYAGSLSSSTRTVAPGFRAAVAVTAPFGQSGAADNMFSALSQAITDLSSGNYGAVDSADLTKFDQAMSGVLQSAASQGAMVEQLTYMQTQSTQTSQDLQTQLGAIQNLDMPALTTQYSEAMNNYQVALQVASTAVQPTLAKYL